LLFNVSLHVGGIDVLFALHNAFALSVDHSQTQLRLKVSELKLNEESFPLSHKSSASPSAGNVLLFLSDAQTPCEAASHVLFV
jgi:hypothetical protein